MKKILMVAAALGAIAFAGSASAATVSCGNKTVTETDSTYAECITPNKSESSPLTFMNMTFLLGINDKGNSTTNSPLSWITDPMDQQGGQGNKPWSIALAVDWIGTLVLELKQGTTGGFFDVTSSCDFDANVCSGTWTTAGNDLSHTRAWYKDGTPPPPTGTVPLPAAGWMLLAALGGLGIAKRRKS